MRADPWQEWWITECLGETPDGMWAAPEAALDVARQNGKGTCLEIRTVYGLVILGEEITHSAHLFATSFDAFKRVKKLFIETPDLMRHVWRGERGISNTAASLGIQMNNGGFVRYRARTETGGRGLGGDLVILDEAFALTPGQMDSLIPTLSARPNPQTIYTSTPPPDAALGEVWMNIRERGESGEPGLLWASWGTTQQDVDVNDIEEIKRSNPAFGYRITRATVARERGQLGPVGFRRERMGLWPERPTTDVVISPQEWEAAKVAAVRPPDCAFAIDVSPDRKWSAISMAGRLADGSIVVQVVDHRAGTAWLAERIPQLHERWNPWLWAVDERSPAATLLDKKTGDMIIRAKGAEPDDPPVLVIKRFRPEPPMEGEPVKIPHRGQLVVMSSVDAATAWGLFVDGVRQTTVHHVDDGVLNGAVRGAKPRKLGDGSAWARRGDTDISSLVASTEAAWELVAYPEVEEGTYDPLGNIF